MGAMTSLWQPKRQRMLACAAFHKDDALAEETALAWFMKYNFEDVNYSEHRLLAHVYQRFPAALNTLPQAPRLRLIPRQLWMRGHIHLAAAQPVFEYFNHMRVPWVLTNPAASFLINHTKIRVAETIPIMVEDAAFTFAISALWRHGFIPPKGTRIYAATSPMHFIGPNSTRLILTSDVDIAPLLANKTTTGYWKNRDYGVYKSTPISAPSDELGQILTLQNYQTENRDALEWLFSAASRTSVAPEALPLSRYGRGLEQKMRKRLLQEYAITF